MKNYSTVLMFRGNMSLLLVMVRACDKGQLCLDLIVPTLCSVIVLTCLWS